MERDFVVRVDGEKRFIYSRKDTVLGFAVEAYGLVDSRRRATVFHGAPEDDAELLERISLYLGRWKRDLVVDVLVRSMRCAQRVFLVRVAASERHSSLWKPGAWVRTVHNTLAGPHFNPCTLGEAQIFTSRRLANKEILLNEKNYNVKFEVVPFAEVIDGS